MLQLPWDVLAMVCEELERRQDFGTLFNCSLTSKSLVYPALSGLYKIQHESPITNEDNDAEYARVQLLPPQAREDFRNRVKRKWALLWKSIVRSSLGATYLPYALYIKVLDLRNLVELLQDLWFRRIGFEFFFVDDMAKFLIHIDKLPPAKKTRTGGKKTAYTDADQQLILNAVGESITSFVYDSAVKGGFEAALEDIAGDISTVSLSRWAGKLSKLKSMTLWNGSALNSAVATSIASKCFGFNDLSFLYYIPGDDSMDSGDTRLASFFSSLRADSLESFGALDAKQIGPETILSLNHHSASLKSLKLLEMDIQGLKNLNLLKGCDKLHSLELTTARTASYVDLEATENDVFLEVIDWMGKCANLQDIHFALLSGPAILTHVCMASGLRLRSITVTDCSLVNNQNFHKALSHQTSLEKLTLTADPEGAFGDDIEVLVSSICQLKKLKELQLVNTSDFFSSHHITRLASNLLNLETFYFSGYDVGDQIWDAMAGLARLQSIYTFGVTSFTREGILKFIDMLKPSNRGLVLAILSQNPQYVMGEEDKLYIQERLAAKGGEKFEFVLYREEDVSGSDLSD
ncbi:hypothetical protein HYALB_00000857 [Hymenoscyphus albidus]|uniref:Uncharacterized protein n=1 Tax=Hymenoscyphus albidus TaxID=595503 RepID=A0A9N9LBR5_9HELO|nr:hypothetical protein HYALB_00000857 [Hymenoscyphus albidus]